MTQAERPPEPPRGASARSRGRRPQTAREQAERIGALLRHALRFLRLGVLVFLLGLAVTVLVAVTRPRVYRSESLILYRERIAAAALDREVTGDPARRIGMRLRELILSRSSLEKIITSVGLYRNVVEDQGVSAAVDLMRSKVGFKSRDGDTYALSFEGEEPEKVQEVARRLTEVLLKESERNTSEVASGTKDFLDAEAARIDADLKKREAQLAQFFSDHPSYATEAARISAGQTGGIGVGMSNPGGDRRGAGETSKRRRPSDPREAALEREIERIQARLEPPPARPSDSPEVKGVKEQWDRSKQEATREVEAAARDLAEKKQSFTDEHPDVKRAKGRYEVALKRLSEAQDAGARALAKVVPSSMPVQPLSEEEKGKLRETLTRLQREMSRFRSQRREEGGAEEKKPAPSDADDIVKLETEYVQLTRAVSEAQEQRKQIENKRFMAEVRDRMAQMERGERMVVVDPPNKPTKPVRGGRMQTAMLGGGVSGGLALLLMLVLALLDDRVYDRYDIERMDLLPVLVTVPPPSKQAQRLLRKQSVRGALPPGPGRPPPPPSGKSPPPLPREEVNRG